MVRLLAGSSIRVLPIRPTYYTSWDKDYEHYLERIKSLWQGVLWGLSGNKGVYSLTCVHPPEGISPVRTHVPLSSFSLSLPFQHNPNRSSRHADRDIIGERLAFFLNPPQMKHVGVKAGKTSRACSEYSTPTYLRMLLFRQRQQICTSAKSELETST